MAYVSAGAIYNDAYSSSTFGGTGGVDMIWVGTVVNYKHWQVDSVQRQGQESTQVQWARLGMVMVNDDLAKITGREWRRHCSQMCPRGTADSPIRGNDSQGFGSGSKDRRLGRTVAHLVIRRAKGYSNCERLLQSSCFS